MAGKNSKSTPAAIGIVKSVEFDDRGAVLSFGDSSSTSTLVLDAEPNVRGAERRLKAFHDVYTVVVKADADDVSAELYGVNHNGEVNRPVPMADALGLWELGVPIRVERAAA
ncbi:MAG: hypothetical protein QF777_01995 [Acidimicrobiales bacterium]|nr:hypothetical protein [Actinomycetes bacterium]MDP6159288.1 hypothetical protein [Acidimicrobiales bacterium]MDP6287270.1 hypothetical protein [Acidimicrobiales bacterium]MDP6910322.1 hypothetical protein [Acidimicrobiales bacterium]HJM73813.1 hypothetical protein [Acidimicrobiales bacterium]